VPTSSPSASLAPYKNTSRLTTSSSWNTTWNARDSLITNSTHYKRISRRSYSANYQALQNTSSTAVTGCIGRGNFLHLATAHFHSSLHSLKHRANGQKQRKTFSFFAKRKGSGGGLYFRAHSLHKQDSVFNVTQRNFMKCTRIFATPICYSVCFHSYLKRVQALAHELPILCARWCLKVALCVLLLLLLLLYKLSLKHPYR
jgi:hypothetical protein